MLRYQLEQAKKGCLDSSGFNRDHSKSGRKYKNQNSCGRKGMEVQAAKVLWFINGVDEFQPLLNQMRDFKNTVITECKILKRYLTVNQPDILILESDLDLISDLDQCEVLKTSAEKKLAGLVLLEKFFQKEFPNLPIIFLIDEIAEIASLDRLMKVLEKRPSIKLISRKSVFWQNHALHVLNHVLLRKGIC